MSDALITGNINELNEDNTPFLVEFPAGRNPVNITSGLEVGPASIIDTSVLNRSKSVCLCLGSCT